MDDNIFGEVTVPLGVQNYDSQASSIGADSIGIVLFASNILNLFAILMGLYVIYNFIMAGYLYITGSGDTGAHSKVKDKITYSVIGLAVIVLAYTIAGIIGTVFFDDPSFILSPTIIGPDGI